MPFKKHNYNYKGGITLAEIAKALDAELRTANPGQIIKNIAPLHSAGNGDLSFFDNTKYIEQFMVSHASACVVNDKYASHAPENMALLVVKEPYRAYARIAQIFYPDIEDEEKIHPSAVIHKTAKLGDNVVIGPNTVIGRHVEIGDNCRIASNVTITSAILGKNCIVHPGVRIGQDGFGFAMGSNHLKVPQLGGVVIGNDVEIGSNSCIDRGSGPNTVIGDGTKIDNLVQIGHNVELGRNCVIVAQVGIAGSTKVGDYTVIGGKVGISGHIKIGNGVKIAAMSGVFRDIPSGRSVAGFPAINIRDWHRTTLAIERLVQGQRKQDD